MSGRSPIRSSGSATDPATVLAPPSNAWGAGWAESAAANTFRLDEAVPRCEHPRHRKPRRPGRRGRAFMRKLLIGGGLGILLLGVVLAACGGSGSGSSEAEARRAQDTWEREQIEKAFHGAPSHK